MVFSSLKFLLVFMPFFYVSYFLVDYRYKNLIIFLYSLSFYAFSCFEEPVYFLNLILILVVNYFAALFIKKCKKYKKMILVLGLLYDFSILFMFKYFNFFTDIIEIILHRSILNKIDLTLPIGISFYTFQLVSYIVDVYYEKIEPDKNFIDYGTYIVMFPQLIAGPIVRYVDIMQEIKQKREFDKNKFIDGIKIFIFGLASKVIIANQISLLIVDINNYGIRNLTFLSSWLAGITFSLQMYFDFFGYSLMAIGLGKTMGFTIVENFDNPFLSRSVTEYWRRWHISLGTWFRDYVLYPVQLSKTFKFLRKKLLKITNIKISNIILNILATFIVWLATGLWHGANYNYLIWGLYFFVFLNIEQIFLKTFLDKHKVFSHLYIVVLIVISFVIFYNEDFDNLTHWLKTMLMARGEFVNEVFYKILIRNYKFLIVAILAVLKIPTNIYRLLSKNKYIDIFVVVSLYAICIFLIYLGYNDPFLYFRF